MSKPELIDGPVSTASQRSLRGRPPPSAVRGFLGVALMVGLFLMMIALSEPLLTVHTLVSAADVIVVPGGDGRARAARAAALYHVQAAPRVLVTGSGDCLEIRDLMVAAHVPKAEITVECTARDTWENASKSAPILNEMSARSAILVTNWFHSRRALGCFRAVAPEIVWMSAPVERDKSLLALAIDPQGVKVAKEYVKTVWYAVRHGVVPGSRAAAPSDGKARRTHSEWAETFQTDDRSIADGRI